jgi:hypothetical protein
MRYRLVIFFLALTCCNCLTQAAWRMASPDTVYDKFQARDISGMVKSRGNTYIAINYRERNLPGYRGLFNIPVDETYADRTPNAPVYIYSPPKNAQEFCAPDCEVLAVAQRAFSETEIALPYQNAIIDTSSLPDMPKRLRMAGSRHGTGNWGRPVALKKVSIDTTREYLLFEYADGENEIFQIFSNGLIARKKYGNVKVLKKTPLQLTSFNFSAGVLVVIGDDMTWVKSDAVSLAKLHILENPGPMRAPSVYQKKGDPWGYVILPFTVAADIVLSPFYLLFSRIANMPSS